MLRSAGSLVIPKPRVNPFARVSRSFLPLSFSCLQQSVQREDSFLLNFEASVRMTMEHSGKLSRFLCDAMGTKNHDLAPVKISQDVSYKTHDDVQRIRTNSTKLLDVLSISIWCERTHCLTSPGHPHCNVKASPSPYYRPRASASSTGKLLSGTGAACLSATHTEPFRKTAHQYRESTQPILFRIVSQIQ